MCQTLHKEELGVSETERRLRERIERHAPLQQKRQRQPSLEQRPAGQERTEPPATAPAPASAPAAAAPSVRRVRVVASPGRQADLTLPQEATFGAFLTEVGRALAVERGRIRRVLHGFPPRQVAIGEEETVPFQVSGGRVTLGCEVMLDLFIDALMSRVLNGLCV